MNTELHNRQEKLLEFSQWSLGFSSADIGAKEIGYNYCFSVAEETFPSTE